MLVVEAFNNTYGLVLVVGENYNVHTVYYDLY